MFFLNRSNSLRCLGIVLLALGGAGACKTKTPDAREQLVSSLKGANVEGYYFATRGDDNQEVASLTNGALRDPIKMGNGNLVLKYTSVKDKKTNTTRTYRTEIIRKDAALTLLVTDIASGETVMKKEFPPPKSRVLAAGEDCSKFFDKVFPDAAACRKDFDLDCRRGSFLQCEANRTCDPVLTELECCFKDGHATASLLIIWPTGRLCLTTFFPDEDLVLTQG